MEQRYAVRNNFFLREADFFMKKRRILPLPCSDMETQIDETHGGVFILQCKKARFSAVDALKPPRSGENGKKARKILEKSKKTVAIPTTFVYTNRAVVWDEAVSYRLAVGELPRTMSEKSGDRLLDVQDASF